MIDDLHIHYARGCAIVAALLVVYLLACAINALGEWAWRKLSPVRGTGVPVVSASGKDRRMAAAIGLERKLARLCKSKTAGAQGASGAGAPGATSFGHPPSRIYGATSRPTLNAQRSTP